jgi:2-hydroxychromene-2-carboxylate isomerase
VSHACHHTPHSAALTDAAAELKKDSVVYDVDKMASLAEAQAKALILQKFNTDSMKRKQAEQKVHRAEMMKESVFLNPTFVFFG